MTIDIVVAVLPGASRNRLAIMASDYASSLIDDLDLPAPASLRLSEDPNGGGDAESVLFSIYANRSVYVTPDLAYAYAAALWPDTHVSVYTAVKLRELMTACVERNIRLRRLTAILQRREPADLWDTWELLCNVHIEEQVTIRVESGSAEWIGAVFGDPEEVWTVVQRRVFDTTGLLVPLPQGVTNRAMPSSEWRLRLNDVALPARRLGNSEAMLNAMVSDLVQSAEALLTRDEIVRRMRLIARDFPVLVDEAKSRVGLNRIVMILGMLVRKSTPVKNLERILDELTCAPVPYELTDATLQIVRSPMEVTWRRRQGEPAQEATPEDYAGALALRLGAG